MMSDTIEAGGKARLRSVAKACRDFGQRVQFSVFEIEVDPAQWTRLKARLEAVIDPEHDSLRYYHLGVELAAQGRACWREAGRRPWRYADRLERCLAAASFEQVREPQVCRHFPEGSRKSSSLKSLEIWFLLGKTHSPYAV